MRNRINVPEHKFRVDQAVEFFPGRGLDHKAKCQYTIVRLLPMDGNIPQYRIKNKADGHERVVRENELGSQKLADSSLSRLFDDHNKKIL
jgi:hypothetical protein